MKALWEQADEIPVTLVLLVAYVTMASVAGLTVMATDPERLHAFGWLSPHLAIDQPWRLLAHAVLHGDLLHLAFNGFMLIRVGPALERSLGSVRFAALYLVAALGGGVAVCLLYPVTTPVVGGSGALFGMFGALVALFARSGRQAFEFLAFDGPRALLGLIAANLVIGWIVPHVSNTAHVGGLLTGFVVTLLWLAPPRAPSAWHGRWRLAVAVLSVSLVFASVMPVTRWDWLWNRSVDAAVADASRSRALQRAAAMSYYAIPRAGDGDVERLYLTVIAPPSGGDARRPR